MPLTGPAPKDSKVTRTPTVHDWVDVPNVPYAGETPSPGRLPTATKRWWDVVSTMPHCANWTPGDWQFALDTARIHAAFSKGDMVRAQELRVRERAMGTTSDALLSLRIRYVDPSIEQAAETGEAADVMDLNAERRKRLAGAS